MKPPGIALGLRDGKLHIGVTGSDRAADKLWEAVEEAILANMTPERFKREMVEAWAYHRKQQAEMELQELRKT
jgi:hypothetical protein